MSSADVYGMVRLAGVDVALPLGTLREVVPCPEQLSGLPAEAPGLLGAMDLRTTVLPVVDLRVVLGRDPARRADQVVVVIAEQGQALGLLADEVCGVTRVPGSALLPVRTQRGELLFSHTFVHPDTGRATSVLDAAAVLRLPGLPTVADTTRSTAAVVVEGAGRPAGRTFTRVRCGDFVLAVDVAQVHTTLPSPDTRPSALRSPLVPGVTGYAGRDIGVVDPLVLLGLGRRGGAPPQAGLVLDTGRGHVVLALDELLDLVQLGEHELLPVPPFAVPRPELLAGLALVGEVSCLVLDGDALLAEPQLRAISAMHTTVGTPDGGGEPDAEAPVAGPPYLTFSVGVDVVAPLAQVTEIVPWPASVTATAATPGVLGVTVHRGAALPVLDLAALLGRPGLQRTPATCLLVVDVDGAPVALAVDALRSIDPLTWTDARQPRVLDGGRLDRALQSAALVQVGVGGRLLPELDLRDVVRAVRGPAAAVPVPRTELVSAPAVRA